MRRFEFSEGSSHKFWSVEVAGNVLTVRYGRIGTAGQTQVKTLASAAAAESQAAKLVAEKSGKGYRETTAEPVATEAAAPTSAAAAVVTQAAEPAPAASGPVVWTPELQKQVLPQRGGKPSKGVPVEKAWLEIAADYQKLARAWTYCKLPFAERLASETPPATRLTWEEEAFCALAFGVTDGDAGPVRPSTAESFVRYWAAKEGPAFTVRALL